MIDIDFDHLHRNTDRSPSSNYSMKIQMKKNFIGYLNNMKTIDRTWIIFILFSREFQEYHSYELIFLFEESIATEHCLINIVINDQLPQVCVKEMPFDRGRRDDIFSCSKFWHSTISKTSKRWRMIKVSRTSSKDRQINAMIYLVSSV